MKKMLALILATLLVLSLASCGSEQKLQLPIELWWGNVTSIETIGENAEAIVLSMQEPPKPEDNERIVYISAVDYIFNHASKNLESVSVSAYDPSGNSIVSFTIPSDIIAGMREVESTGSWGEVGFFGYYWFNHDAYDELVVSISTANGVVQKATEYATATAEATINNPSIKSENMTIAFSYGERSGMYVGFVDENGLPDGTGTFESVNSEGVKWTYSGDWKHGHLDGHGIRKWETGEKYCGQYVSDEESGYGVLWDSTGAILAGNFENGHLNGYGAVYVGDDVVFWGNYNDGNSESGKVYLSDGSIVDASHLNNNISYVYKTSE